MTFIPPRTGCDDEPSRFMAIVNTAGLLVIGYWLWTVLTTVVWG